MSWGICGKKIESSSLKISGDTMGSLLAMSTGREMLCPFVYSVEYFGCFAPCWLPMLLTIPTRYNLTSQFVD